MIQRVLIANRGEIALRILRACRESGIKTVGAYARVDRNLRHLDYTDAAFCISETDYMDMDSLLMAARLNACDAIHPGYGFLSENAGFARRVEEEGLIWIGPDADTIGTMANKSLARSLVAEHGLCPIPGSEGNLENVEDAKLAARNAGYPVVLKATWGGGGRGIRIVEDEASLGDAFEQVTHEAGAIWGQPEIYLEKFLDDARHIEIQIMGDGRGKAIHMGSRECSIQRRRQKLIEESPAADVDEEALNDLARNCVKLAEAIKYRSAGTLEFLYQDGEFWFMEMNTRIQVEHPVTEMTTGQDLVQMQLDVAMDGNLPVQHDVVVSGHAIECRINAEDIDYRPSPGQVKRYRSPGGPGIRVDTHLYEGYHVPHEYDSMIAKIISHGRDREEAIRRMLRGLDEFEIAGVETNRELHKRILNDDRFRRVRFNTRSLDDRVFA